MTLIEFADLVREVQRDKRRYLAHRTCDNLHRLKASEAMVARVLRTIPSNLPDDEPEPESRRKREIQGVLGPAWSQPRWLTD